MKRTTIPFALFALFALTACSKSEPTPTPSRAAAEPAATTVDFSGTFSSTFGPATFTQTGTKVKCRYSTGSMDCDVIGEQLKCTWRESSTFGLAVLHKTADGKLTGTWGNGGSERDGGQWTFIPKR